jgi:hypothetical protein
MLFPYPHEATANNWLHQSLVIMITSAHQSIQEGITPQAWPLCIPDIYRPTLSRRHGLRDKFGIFIEKLAALSPQEQTSVVQALATQNDIVRLLAKQADCPAIGELPPSVRDPISDLFGYAFNILTDLGTRDELYEFIYTRMAHRICPFCGCESFASPQGAREDLDHYLLKDKYPFAAANLSNLAPMGRECNQKYKLTQDILLNPDLSRRSSYFPYGAVSVTVSLTGSTLFCGADPTAPTWQIQFVPEAEETRTWAQVFKIRERYINDVLNPEFSSWLEEFSYFCGATDRDLNSDAEVMDALTRFILYQSNLRLQDRAFLKVEVFRVLHAECSSGDRRALDLIRAMGLLGQS